MKKILILRYGELSLKKLNKKDFIHKIVKNLKNKISDSMKDLVEFGFDFVSFTYQSEEQKNEFIEIAKSISGFHSILDGYIVNSKKEDIVAASLKMFSDSETKSGTFKVEVKRNWKEFEYDSNDFKRIIAAEILGKTKFRVDIHSPDKKLNIKINPKTTFIYFEKVLLSGGFPTGINGKALMLLSGGIDSPVASYLLMKKGMHVDYITFITPPFTTEKALDKVRDLKKVLDKYNDKPSRLFICNFTRLQKELAHMQDESYRITVMRRCFIKISKLITKKYGYDAIGTGESIGQVASQTLESMNCIMDNMNILKLCPVIAMDKNEIIDIAKKIKTYEISILPYDDSCSLFAPKNPITRPKIEKVLKNEEGIELLEDMIKYTFEKEIMEE